MVYTSICGGCIMLFWMVTAKVVQKGRSVAYIFTVNTISGMFCWNRKTKSEWARKINVLIQIKLLYACAMFSKIQMCIQQSGTPGRNVISWSKFSFELENYAMRHIDLNAE